MTRRRRPLLPEEKTRRRLRTVATGSGQANARAVRVSPTRTSTGGAGGQQQVYVEPVASIVARGYAYISFDPA